MRYRIWIAAGILAAFLAGSHALDAAGRAKQARPADDERAESENPERVIAQAVRQMQMDLEGSSSRSFMSHFEAAKFDDFPRFEEMIDRLLRENSLRVFFRQVSNSFQQDAAQSTIDAEMELTRKDAAGQIDRRRQQLVIDFQRTSRGWKIINLTPRDFFRPQ
ncbi:MAG: hypothetical protein HY649_02015 [Acidobacteria bacterium]|nr:hypothetical protein [Acidobacteriota bacterium]